MHGQQYVLHEIFDLGRACEAALAADDLPNAGRDRPQQLHIRVPVALLGSAHQVAERIEWRVGCRHASMQSTPRVTFFRRAPNLQALVE
jgi:hypothetical protein